MSRPAEQEARLTFRNWLFIALGLIAFLAVAYYIVFPSRGFIHSDSTDTILWAEASFDSGRIISKDFSYAAILPFGGSLLMLPLIPVFGVSMTTQIIGMLLFAALFFGSIFFLGRQMSFDAPWIGATVFLLTLNCSASEKLREMFWGHTIYYSLGMLLLFIALGLSFKVLDLLERQERRKYDRTLPILFLFSMLAATNGIQVLALCLIPILGAVFGDMYLNQEQKLLHQSNKPSWILLLILFAASILGLLLGYGLQRGNHDIYAGAFTNFSGMGLWLTNAAALALAWFNLLGVTVAENDTLFSLASSANVLRLLGGVILLILPACFLFQYKKIRDRKLRLLFSCHLIIAVLVASLFIAGKLYSAAWRLTPVVCSATLFAVAYCRYLIRDGHSRRIAKTILVVLGLTAALSLGTIAGMPPDNTADNKIYQLTRILQDHQVQYGYATFWQASAITLVSDSKIKVRNIEADTRGITPRRFQSQPSWYEDQPGLSEYFLILTKQEYLDVIKSEKWPELEKILASEFPALDFRVLVLKQNPFS